MTASSLRCVVLFLLALMPLVAQDITGTISGTVTDSSGAVVPGASVVVTNTATAVVAFRGVTNESGNYSAPSLPVGTYRVAVEMKGFKKSEIQGVVLQVDQRARINVMLQPGEIAETVTVVGEGMGLLESESSSMGSLINTSQVKDPPMPNRNVLNLLTLVGGVSSGGAATGINASQLSMNGSRTLNSEFAVDGVSVVSGSTGGVQRVPSTEAVRQVPFNNLSTVAPAAFRSGDFSGSPVPVNDPATNTPFPGNRIPPTRIDAAATKVMGLLPLPNSPGTEDRANGRSINNFLSAGSTGVVDNQYTFRGDHSVGTKARFFGRFSTYKVSSPSGEVLPGPLDSRVGDSLTTGYQLSSSWTHIWTPSLISEAWLGF